MARSGRRTAVVERRWIGGSCPNVNCLPSKNEIQSAKSRIAWFAYGAEYGGEDGCESRSTWRRFATGEARAWSTSRSPAHLAQLQGERRRADHGLRPVRGPEDARGPAERRRRAAPGRLPACSSTSARSRRIPGVPGLEAARPLTNIEALELEYLFAASHCAGGRVRGAGTGPRPSRVTVDRPRAAADEPRGSRRLGGAAAHSHR